MCGSMLLIRICLMGERYCYLGTSSWVTSGCYVLCFPEACVILITGGSTLTMGGVVLTTEFT